MTLDTNTIGLGCSADTGGEGSSGFAGIPVSVSSVPEPIAFLLFGLGLAGLFVFRKRASLAA